MLPRFAPFYTQIFSTACGKVGPPVDNQNEHILCPACAPYTKCCVGAPVGAYMCPFPKERCGPMLFFVQALLSPAFHSSFVDMHGRGEYNIEVKLWR